MSRILYSELTQGFRSNVYSYVPQLASSLATLMALLRDAGVEISELPSHISLADAPDAVRVKEDMIPPIPDEDNLATDEV